MVHKPSTKKKWPQNLGAAKDESIFLKELLCAKCACACASKQTSGQKSHFVQNSKTHTKHKGQPYKQHFSTEYQPKLK